MNLLFPELSKEKKAIERLIAHQPPEGYSLQVSGGKDSQAILLLGRIAGVRFDAHMNLTSVDPIEVIRFVRENYPEVILEKPEYSMRQLIIMRKMPPTAQRRYCCDYLKKRGGEGRFVVLGTRAQEAPNRKNWKMVDFCAPKRKKILNPIIDWNEEDVWEYLKKNRIKSCKLYEEGFNRIGCVGCPKAGPVQMEREFARWPHFKKVYLHAFDDMLEERKKYPNLPKCWVSAEHVMAWFLRKAKLNSDVQKKLFDIPNWEE